MEDFFVQECCVHGTDLENHGPTSMLCDDPLPIESNTYAILRHSLHLMLLLSWRFRTEAHQDVVHRFNERFILSLASNTSCIFLDDNLNILPLSSHVKTLEKVSGAAPVSDREEDLQELKSNLQDTQPVGALVNLAR